MNFIQRLIQVPLLSRKLKGATAGYIDTLDQQVDERPALYGHNLIHWITKSAGHEKTRRRTHLFFKLADCLQQRELGLTSMEPRQIRGFRMGKEMPRFWDEFSMKLGPDICPSYSHAIALLLEFEKANTLNHDGYRVTTTAWDNRTYWMEGDASHRIAALHHWSAANPGRISFVVRETLEWIDESKIQSVLQHFAFYLVNADADLQIMRSLDGYPDFKAVQFHTLTDPRLGFTEKISIASVDLDIPVGAAVSNWLQANCHPAAMSRRVLNVGELFKARCTNPSSRKAD